MNDQIRPFRVEIPQRDLDDLNARLGWSRWPDPLQGVDPDDRSRGIPQSDVAVLVEN